jgi:sugar O-acyltransferase (sialic acid O-acetyltransferase NeuD family)
MRKNIPRVIFGLYGAGGFAREVMPVVTEYISRARLADPEKEYGIFFIETNPTKNKVNGYALVSEDEFFSMNCEERYFNVAIADSKARQIIANRCIKKGAKPMSIQSTNSVMYDENDIDEGVIICAYSTVTSNTKIGKFFHSNIYSYVAHDCVIGDYVTFAPRVHCNGHVHIEDHAYIGTGAVLKPGNSGKPLIIGEGAIVGMGAVVTRDVAPYTTVVGNPAKPYNKE